MLILSGLLKAGNRVQYTTMCQATVLIAAHDLVQSVSYSQTKAYRKKPPAENKPHACPLGVCIDIVGSGSWQQPSHQSQ